MKSNMIQEELIQLDMEVENQEEFFQKMADKLKTLSYVEDSFYKAIKEREEEYPTAIPMSPYPVAIPHADKEHIKRPFIAFTRLKTPIVWKEMGNEESEHLVRFIMILGFVQEIEYLELLQDLIVQFQDEEFMEHLCQVENKEQCKKLLLNIEEILS